MQRDLAIKGAPHTHLFHVWSFVKENLIFCYQLIPQFHKMKKIITCGEIVFAKRKKTANVTLT